MRIIAITDKTNTDFQNIQIYLFLHPTPRLFWGQDGVQLTNYLLFIENTYAGVSIGSWIEEKSSIIRNWMNFQNKHEL